MPVWQIQYDRIPELPGEGGRLGRHAKVDSRSAAYPYQRSGAPVVAKTWTRHNLILDQGNLGSCTGNAEVGALGTDPLFATMPPNLVLDEGLAVAIYSAAEILDGGPGLPGEDNGSSGSSVCQVAKNDGYISGYTWCNDETDVLDALMAGPVLLGVNWYSSFDTPSPAGVVSLPATARIRGGHEIVARQVDVTSNLIGCDNSWGAGWGMGGRFFLPYSILTRLLREQGDCAAPLPVTSPPPVPVPVPPAPDVRVDAADRALAAAVPAGWESGHHRFDRDTATAARAYVAWKQAKRL